MLTGAVALCRVYPVLNTLLKAASVTAWGARGRAVLSVVVVRSRSGAHSSVLLPAVVCGIVRECAGRGLERGSAHLPSLPKAKRPY